MTAPSRADGQGVKGEDEKGQELDEDDEAPLDPLDIFDDGISNLFSVAPIAFSSHSFNRLLTYRPPRSTETKDHDHDHDHDPIPPIRLQVPTPSAEVFAKLQANHLWLSAIYLADQLSLDSLDLPRSVIPSHAGTGVGPRRHEHLGKTELGRTRVIELGAGTGLPGIMANLKGCDVLSTDWDDQDILDSLKSNFERNAVSATPSSSHAVRWEVQGHQWGTDVSPLLGFNRRQEGRDADHKFDVILLADTLWVSSAHTALLDSIQSLLAPSGIVHIAAGLHTGRRPIETFVELAVRRGFRVDRVGEAKWVGDVEEAEGTRWEEIPARMRDSAGPAASSGTEEERGVVVHLTMSWAE